MQDALTQYLAGKEEAIAAESVRVVRTALQGLLQPALDEPCVGLTPGRAQRLYDQLRARPVVRVYRRKDGTETSRSSRPR